MTDNIFDSIEVVAAPLIVNSKGEILLIKSHKWGDVYLFPGGHVEQGETIFDAAKREGKEETSLELEPQYCVNIHEVIFDPAFTRRAHLISFHVVCKALTEGVILENSELQEYIWIDTKKALDLPNIRVKKSIENYLEGKKIDLHSKVFE